MGDLRKSMYSWLKILSFMACMLASVVLHAQVTANFTASSAGGCAPLLESFANTSTGATSYSWNLGNGTNSTLQNASGSYLTPGTYTVTLTASNGSATSTKTLQVTVHAPPVVSFTAIDTVVCNGVAAVFSNTTNPVSSGPATYNWDFGDGTSSAQQNPTHMFTGPGYYTITLSATNSDGCSSSLVQNAYIHVLSRPVSMFTQSATTFCGSSALVLFTDQSTGNGALSYLWRFGDNTTGTGASPSHNYTAGTYSIREIVTDSHGCKDSSLSGSNIIIDNPVASFTAPDSVCQYLNFTIINTSPSSVISSSWSFGDGGVSSLSSPMYAYGAAGPFTIKLIAFDGSCYDTVSKAILVKQAPVIGFTFTPAHPCPAPVTVQFSSTAPAGSTYLWTFSDDASTSTAANPAHVYNTDSFHTVTLQVTNFCVSTIVDTVKVYDMQPNVTITPYISGCAPLSVNFAATLLTFVPQEPLTSYPYPYPITSYSWNFADGSPSSSSITAAHTYTAFGAHNPYVILTTANGCTEVDTLLINVGQKPTVTSFTASPVHLCRRDTITFHGVAIGAAPLYYYYDNGQPGIGGDEGIGLTTDYHVYSLPGIFQARLIASNYGCQDSSAPITITVDSPAAVIGFAYRCDTPLSVSFVDSSVGATSVVWLLGDGTTSTSRFFKHTYASPGTYTVKQAAFNSTSGCRDTAVASITVFVYVPKIQVNDTAICKGTQSTFTATHLSGPPPISHNWAINNRNIDTATTIYYYFDSVRINTVLLTDQDVHKCLETTQQNIYVSKPSVSFSANPLQACLPAAVSFTDNSTFLSGTYAVYPHMELWRRRWY